MSSKGRSDYYAPGDYNACCDRCCAKFKASKLKRDWKGLVLCEWCWEPRHPQDFVRGIADPAPVPWVRLCCGDNFVDLCPLPVPTFTYAANPENEKVVTFTNTTFALETRPNTFLWDFGDGTTSTQSSIVHTFGSDTYDVTLTVTNECGAVTTEPITFAFGVQLPTLPYTMGLPSASSPPGVCTTVLLPVEGVTQLTGLWTTEYYLENPPNYRPLGAPSTGTSTPYFAVNTGGDCSFVDIRIPPELGAYYFSYEHYGSDEIETIATTDDNVDHYYTGLDGSFQQNPWNTRSNYTFGLLPRPIVRLRLNLVNGLGGAWFVAGNIKFYGP